MEYPTARVLRFYVVTLLYMTYARTRMIVGHAEGRTQVTHVARQAVWVCVFKPRKHTQWHSPPSA